MLLSPTISVSMYKLDESTGSAGYLIRVTDELSLYTVICIPLMVRTFTMIIKLWNL